VPQELFKQTMSNISQNIDTEDFIKPDSVVEVDVEKGSNPAALPSEHTPSDRIVTELFVKGTEPSSVSEEFDELEPVKNLSGSFNEENNEIDVEWEYEDSDNIEFEVSYKVNDGSMKELTTTEDKEVTISSIEEDSAYTIQVIAVDTESDIKSEPATTTVEILDDDIPAVSDLKANYDESNESISVNWSYDGPEAKFEVDINGNKQTVDSTSIDIRNVTPDTYTITVTPVVDDKRGDSKETTISIDEEEVEEEQQEEQENENPEEDQDQQQEENEEEDTEEQQQPDENEEEEEEPEEENEQEDNQEQQQE